MTQCVGCSLFEKENEGLRRENKNLNRQLDDFTNDPKPLGKDERRRLQEENKVLQGALDEVTERVSESQWALETNTDAAEKLAKAQEEGKDYAGLCKKLREKTQEVELLRNDRDHWKQRGERSEAQVVNLGAEVVNLRTDLQDCKLSADGWETYSKTWNTPCMREMPKSAPTRAATLSFKLTTPL
jgi:chromosome segregation ATPase